LAALFTQLNYSITIGNGIFTNHTYMFVIFPTISSLRSKVEFDFKKHCLFCGQLASVYDKKRKHDVYPVRTSDFQTKIEDVCKMRDDEWALDVRGRLEFVQDLHAADALYHQSCPQNRQCFLKSNSTFDLRLCTLDSFLTSLFAKAHWR
jgi:hypothetical protein